MRLKNRPVCGDYGCDSIKYFSMLGEAVNDAIPLRISQPGPHYLFFLERGFIAAGANEDSKDDVTGGEEWQIVQPRGDYEPCFVSFLEAFNDIRMKVKDGLVLDPKYQDNRAPRELVWFYGTERLEVTQSKKHAKDDWKSLPKLLWV